MPVLGTVRSRAVLTAALLAAGLTLLCAAGPAAAAKAQRLKTGIVGDADAQLGMVLQKDKKGNPTAVRGLEVTGYDLDCSSIPQPTLRKTFEADFSFAAMDVVPKRKGRYRYAFSGKADDGNPFSAIYEDHSGVAKGFFTAGRSGKPTQLEGYLGMAALSYSLPGLTPPAVCGDPVRDNPFQKLHGSFSVPLG